MVEAALIYPIVIGCIMCVIYIIINMYTCLGINVALSLELREKLMAETKTGSVYLGADMLKNEDLYTAKAFGKEIHVCVKQEGMKKKLSGNILTQTQGNSLLKSFKININKERGLVDEVEYIRMVDLL